MLSSSGFHGPGQYLTGQRNVTLTVLLYQGRRLSQRTFLSTSGQLNEHREVHAANHFNFGPEKGKTDIGRSASEKVGKDQDSFSLVYLSYRFAQMFHHFFNRLIGLKAKGSASWKGTGYQFRSTEHFFSEVTMRHGNDADQFFLILFGHSEFLLQMDIPMENAYKVIMLTQTLAYLVCQDH